MNEIFAKLMDILKEQVPTADPTAVTMDSRLREDLGIDSLRMMMLAIVVEDSFGFRFEGTPTLNTVGDLCDHIAKATA